MAHSFISEAIRQSGAIPFRRFMELALYDPSHGFYASGRAGIGREGDFITSVSVGPLFGRLLSEQFEEMWRALGAPALFTLVEQGANNGDFAHDVLTSIEKRSPEFFRALRYHIVEPFAFQQGRQQERLASFSGKVAWVNEVDALPPFTGVHFSNELLDAFPVHALLYRDGVWQERYVDLSPEGEFIWSTGPFSDERLPLRVAALPAIEGYTTEMNLAAEDWIASVAPRLEKGYILIADYGFSRRDYYLPERIEGTLTGYYQQKRSDDLLKDPGSQDLTAHVEFSTLAEAASRAGLSLAGFTDQHHFMVGLGSIAFPDATAPLSSEEQRERRAFATLMHPGLMGRGFQYIAFAKESPLSLAGFRFASDAKRALFPAS